jgi:hypothetical protein
VFPARYELNSYIVFRKRLVSKRLIMRSVCINFIGQFFHSYLICDSGLRQVHSISLRAGAAKDRCIYLGLLKMAYTAQNH